MPDTVNEIQSEKVPADGITLAGSVWGTTDHKGLRRRAPRPEVNSLEDIGEDAGARAWNHESDAGRADEIISVSHPFGSRCVGGIGGHVA